MVDFSLLTDQNDVVRGIWLRNPDKANDRFFLMAIVAWIANEQGHRWAASSLSAFVSAIE